MMLLISRAIQGAVCFASNISAFDADFPQKLVDTYGITDVGRRTLGTITNPGISMSEDCLTLNIWTKPQTGERKKAVPRPARPTIPRTSRARATPSPACL